MSVPSLQLDIALRILVDVLNGEDETLQRHMTRTIEQETGHTLRTREEETTLRSPVRLADIDADRGVAAARRLGDRGAQRRDERRHRRALCPVHWPVRWLVAMPLGACNTPCGVKQ